MFGHTYYHASIRKYVAYFGTLFNDIVIHRTDANGNSTAVMTVPLYFARKDKMLARVKQDPNLDKETAIVMPTMGFSYTNMSYDGERHLNPLGRSIVKHSTNVNKFKTQYNPVPWDIDFELYILVKFAEDGTKNS